METVKVYWNRHRRERSLLFHLCLACIAVVTVSLSPLSADPLKGLRESLPETDLPAAATAARHLANKVPEILDLAADAATSGKTVAEIQGVSGGLRENAEGIQEPIPLERSYARGNTTWGLVAQMASDYGRAVTDFYGGEADWAITGLCNKKTKFWPYQQYTWPAIQGEISSDLFRGKYLDRYLIRSLFKRMLFSGFNAPISMVDDVEFAPDAFDVGDFLAPYEMNRVRQVAAPEDDGQQSTPATRAARLAGSVGKRGGVPKNPSEATAAHSNPYALKRGAYNSTHRDLEYSRFSALQTILPFDMPRPILGNCHIKYVTESIFPVIHRSDNPVVFPFARSSVYSELLMLIRGAAEKVVLASMPGRCMQYNLMNRDGLVGALGAYPTDDRFGTVAKLNRGFSGAATLAGASEVNCLQSAGAIYPVTNRVAGGKNFKANFLTRMLRADVLTNLISNNQLPSFHQTPGRGSRWPTKIQITDSSFGSTPPMALNTPWWETVWKDPDTYSNQRKGTNIDIASFVEWHTYECCPPGMRVIKGDEPQIRGHERYNRDQRS
ncbi:hypothetical protein MRY87_08270 [bacterium]|nr:hypothetical protein [bacterium]